MKIEELISELQSIRWQDDNHGNIEVFIGYENCISSIKDIKLTEDLESAIIEG